MNISLSAISFISQSAGGKSASEDGQAKAHKELHRAEYRRARHLRDEMTDRLRKFETKGLSLEGTV